MANQDPATKGDIERVVTLLQQWVERMDRRFDQMHRRFDTVDRRFDSADTRLDKIGDTLLRWSDRVDRNQTSILGTQEAQQRAIDSLAERVTRLEQRNQN